MTELKYKSHRAAVVAGVIAVYSIAVTITYRVAEFSGDAGWLDRLTLSMIFGALALAVLTFAAYVFVIPTFQWISEGESKPMGPQDKVVNL